MSNTSFVCNCAVNERVLVTIDNITKCLRCEEEQTARDERRRRRSTVRVILENPPFVCGYLYEDSHGVSSVWNHCLSDEYQKNNSYRILGRILRFARITGDQYELDLVTAPDLLGNWT